MFSRSSPIAFAGKCCGSLRPEFRLQGQRCEDYREALGEVLFRARDILHRLGLRDKFRPRADRGHKQRTRGRHRRLGVRARYARGDPVARSESCPPASGDYLTGAEITIRKALAQAKRTVTGFKPDHVVGLGVDTTGSTPMPVDTRGRALAFDKRFARNPAAMAWLWKDHTGVLEAAEITETAMEMRPQYLAKCGGIYSSEWFFSKILHCLHTSTDVFNAAYTWVEIADWIPAMLAGTEAPDKLTVGICAAGHKAMYNDTWGGYPDAEFLGTLHPKLGELRSRLPAKAHTIERSVGGLTGDWARRTGLPTGIPVAVGAFDAHLGAIGAGVAPGKLVKIIGTSTCDIMLAPVSQKLTDIPGCVASSMAVYFRDTMDWKRDSRRLVTSSIGLLITSSRADDTAHMKP